MSLSLWAIRDYRAIRAKYGADSPERRQAADLLSKGALDPADLRVHLARILYAGRIPSRQLQER